MSKEIEMTDRLLKLRDRHPKIFDVRSFKESINDYILNLNKKTKSAFLLYTCPCIYKPTVLDAYADNCITTFPSLMKTGGLMLSSLLHNDEALIEAGFGFDQKDKDQIIISIAIHANNPKYYFDFIEKHKKDIHAFEEPAMGFNK